MVVTLSATAGRRAPSASRQVTHLLFSVILLGLSSGSVSVRIDSIFPEQGGTAGGTRLTIFGSGFSGDHYTGRNVVRLGPHECEVLEYYSNAYMITCITPAVETDNSFPVHVEAGGLAAQHCCFAYAEWASPEVEGIWPRSALPGEEVLLWGPHKGMFDTWDAGRVINSIRLGEQYCEVDPEAGEEALWRDGDHFYLRCTLPAMGSGDIEVSFIGQAGPYNLTLEFAPSSDWAGGGYAAMANRIADVSGRPYDLQIHPLVTSMEPHSGSLAGGSEVTLTGAGFPTVRAADAGSAVMSADVDIILPGRSKCNIRASNNTHLVCITEAAGNGTPAGAATVPDEIVSGDEAEAAVSALAAAFHALHPGGRGMEYALWYNQTEPDRDWQPQLAWDLLLANTSSMLSSEFHAPRHPQDDKFVDAIRTFFVPPVDGRYTFWINSDDSSILWAAFTNSDTGETEVRELLRSDYAPYGDWYKNENQRSEELELQAGQAVLLLAARFEDVGYEHLQVGVTVPTSTPRRDATSEVQLVSLSAEMHGMQQALRTYYSDPVDSIFRLEITSSNGVDALDSTDLAVMLRFSPEHQATLSLRTEPGQLSRELSALLRTEVVVTAECLPAEAKGVWTITVTPSTDISGTVAPTASAVSALGESTPPTGTESPATQHTPPAVTSGIGTSPPTPSPMATEGSNDAEAVTGAQDLNGGAGQRRLRQDGEAEGDGSGEDAVEPSTSSSVGWCGSGGSSQTDPSTVQATVSTVQHGVGLPRDGFEVYPLAMPELSVSIAAGSAEDDVKQAVELLLQELSAEQLGDMSLSVSSQRVIPSDGQRLPGIEYVLEFPMLPRDSPFTLPRLGIRVAGADDSATGSLQPAEAPSVACEAEVVAEQTEVFGGAVELSAPFTGRSAVIPITSSALQVKTLLRDLAGVSCRQVDVQGDPAEGEVHWELTLDPLQHFGNMPQMEIDWTGLQGTSTRAVIETLRNGARSYESRPIAGDFLRQPIPHDDAVEVWVNGALGVCEAENGGGCGWRYSEELTPQLSAVDPLEGRPGQAVTLTGSRFADTADANAVWIGGAECLVTSASSTSLECEIQQGGNGTAGTHPVVVTVAGVGRAAYGSDDAQLEFTLRVLEVRSVSPSLISQSTGSSTVLEIVGAGFDSAHCGNNVVMLGESACSVVPPCESSRLRCVARPTSSGPAELSVTAAGERAVLSSAVDVSADGANAPSLHAIETESVPSAGGSLQLLLDGNLQADGVSSVHLLPVRDVPGGTTEAAFSLEADTAEECVIHADISELTRLECTLGRLQPGRYRVMLTTAPSGVQLVADDVITASLSIDSVYPTTGSMAGGSRLTITGSGFSSDTAGENAVWLTVPVSTTFPAGVIPCDVIDASEGRIVCSTRPHCSGNARAFLPGSCELQATEVGEVVVALCNAGLSDTARLRCLFGAGSRPPAPRAACTAPSQDCSFAYTSTSTTRVSSVSPAVVTTFPTTLTLTGSGLSDGCEVQVGGQPCPVSSASTTSLRCSAPELPAGRHRVQLRAADGSAGWVNATVAYIASISAVSATHVSLAGGGSLTLSTSGPPYFATEHSGADNIVTLGGLPCNVTHATQDAVTCTTPSVTRRLRADYYNADGWARDGWAAAPPTLPPPLASSTVVFKDGTGLALDWGWGQPAQGISSDLFLAELSGWLLVPESGLYTLELAEGAEMATRLWVDDAWVAEVSDAESAEVSEVASESRPSIASVELSAGFHSLRLLALERRGRASVALRWAPPSADDTAATVPLPASALFALRPGRPVAVETEVAGQAALPACASTNVEVTPYPPPSAAAPSTDLPPYLLGAIVSSDVENTALVVDGDQCAVLPSTFATPILVRATVLGSGLAEGGVEIRILGYGLDLTASSSLGPVAVALRSAVDPSATAQDGASKHSAPCDSIRTESSDSDELSSITCVLPHLPAAEYQLVASVVGSGDSINALPVTYGTRISGISTTRGSMNGGTVVTLSGANFAGNESLVEASRFEGSVLVGNLPCEPSLVSSSVIVCTTTCCAGRSGNAQWGNARVQLPSGAQASLDDPSFALHDDYTPNIESVSHDGDPSVAPFHLAVDLRLPSAFEFPENVADGNERLSALSAELSIAINGSSCTDVVVASVSTTEQPLVASLSCEIPTAFPGGAYVVRSSLAGFGHSDDAILALPVVITGMAPTASSLAGGLPVTITGSSFSSHADEVTVNVGNSTAEVLSSGPQGVVFLVPRGLARAEEEEEALWEVTIRGSLQAGPLFAGTITASAAKTAVLDAISPTHGSSAGGTPVTIILSNVPPDTRETEVEVLFDGQTAPDVTMTRGEGGMGSATVQCLSPAPLEGSPRLEPVAVEVRLTGSGLASGDAEFSFLDLWSASSTWGGGLPPFEGDSVVVPAGTTILLDVSPPRLGALVLEGVLRFDPTAAELRLDAEYIIVAGGALLAGSEAAPHPGSVTITMHGEPKAVELPVYGAKCVALREGRVALFGRRKRPSWTRLAATVHPGESRLTLEVAVEGWEVGDEVVVAPSSFFAGEVDKARIAGIDVDGAGRAVLTLDKALQYSHLGEAETMGGRTVSMAAEVAVLSRNVVVQGDASSTRSGYGAHILMHGRPSTTNEDGTLQPQRALLQLQDVEVRRAGQAFRVGRYPIHFHMHGDAVGSFVRHSTIHTTFNRAITLHGSDNIDVSHNVGYDNAGHAFFLEDGIERGNVLEGNLGLLTRRSHSLLATDTTPATFWVTNPDNTLRNNVAAGSEGYGFWYRMLDHPEGASFTTDVCPKFIALAGFANNTAHSNLIYGLRVFPEYYPNSNPCDPSKGDHVLAAFERLTAYKNGMKGAIATQVGLVQFRDFVVVDCGGGPFAHKVNGKDHGGGIEFTWIIDGRNRSATEVSDMAGVVGALIVAKSELTQRQAAEGRGTAARWPSTRGVRGLITQSLPQGTSQSSAFMQATDITWVGFTPEVGPQFVALEACGKCKEFQGGQTTFLRRASFVGMDATPGALAAWSWPHQGVFYDVDGTLLGGPPGATLHAGSNGLLEAEPLCSVDDAGNGIVCGPELTFRRTMLNRHSPMAIRFRDLLVSAADGTATSRVGFTKYNDNGYQWTVPTGRNYYLHWDSPERVDPEGFTLHEMEEMGWDDWVLYHTRHLRLWNHWKVNGVPSDTEAPLPTDPRGLSHGASAYERLLRANPLDGGREDTRHTIYVAGTQNTRLRVTASICPPAGCPNDGLIPEPEADYRQGKLLWSDASTWTDAGVEAPLNDGDNVTIPAGWDVVLDTSTPRLNRLTIAGNLTFGRVDVELHAVAIVVAWGGRLQVGTEEEPHAYSARVVLHGNKQSPPVAVNDDFIPGAKVLTAFQGGSIDMHGARHARRWTRLATTATAGSATLELLEAVDWEPGSRVLVTSSSYNPDQAEVAVLQDVLAGGTVLLLSGELMHEHVVLSSSTWEGGPTLGAEVGLLDSNIVIQSGDGEGQQMSPDASDPLQGQKFGAYVVAHGDDTSVRLSEVTIRDCGQHGVSDYGNSCLRFFPGHLREGSYIRDSVIQDAMAGGLRVEEGSNGLDVVGNVVAGTYDAHGMHFASGGSLVSGNLVSGTSKVMEGKSSFDRDLPASFSVMAPGNRVVGNVAAGSHRVGFRVVGAPLTMAECRDGHSDGSSSATTAFAENVAHSSLVGLLLEGSDAECTGALRFVAWRNWDFGVLAGLEGIRTSVLLEGAVVVDTRHAGVLILKRGKNTEEHEANILDGLIQGQSGGEGACGPCPSFQQAGAESGGEPGCHPRLSRSSYTGGPTFGLVSATFAARFTSGPEQKPWDGLMGYPTTLGRAAIKGVTFADFYGDDGCGDGSHAITNHPLAPDAFHPHEFSDITLQRIAVSSGGLLKLQSADPKWRHPSDCGEAVFVSPVDGTSIPLNCDGPMHVLLKDMDGSLFWSMGSGGPSAVVGVAPIAGAARPIYAQGTPVADGPCPFIDDAPVSTPGYICLPGWSTASDGIAVPLDGLWGDPQLFVIESRDKDSEDRNFGPVLLGSGGAVDLLTPCMDHGWCFGYTCQKRLSTYWATVASDQTFSVNTTGTPPRNMRLWFPYAEGSSEVVLVINYFEINRRYLWLEGVGRLSPAATPPTVGDGQPHGAYVWQQSEGLLRVKLTGSGRVLEVRTEAVLNINAQLAIGFDEFFEDGFVENVAAVLGIDASRIKVVSIVPGSVVLELEIAEDPAVLDGPVPELVIDTSRNVDAQTQREMRGDEAAQTEYLEQQADESSESTTTEEEGVPSAGETVAALRDVVARLNATVRSGEFSAATGVELLDMTVTWRSGEQLEDELTFSLNEQESVVDTDAFDDTSPDPQPVVLITSVAAATVALLSAAALALFMFRRRRKRAARRAGDDSSDGDIDKSDLQPFDSKHSNAALLDAVASVFDSSDRRIRVRSDDDDDDDKGGDGFEAHADAKTSISVSLMATDNPRESEVEGRKAKRSPVPPSPLRVDSGADDGPRSLQLNRTEQATPVKSPRSLSPVAGSTLTRRVSSNRRGVDSPDVDFTPVDHFDSSYQSAALSLGRPSSEAVAVGSSSVRRSVGDDDEWLKQLNQLPDVPPSFQGAVTAAHARHTLASLTENDSDGQVAPGVVRPDSAELDAFERCWSSAAFNSAFVTSGHYPNNPTPTLENSSSAATLSAPNLAATQVDTTELPPLLRPPLGGDGGVQWEGIIPTGSIGVSQPGSADHVSGERRPRDTLLGSPSSEAPVQPRFVQPDYAEAILGLDGVGDNADSSMGGSHVIDKGVKAASRYTYAKQGETYAGAVVAPRDPAPPRGQPAVAAGTFQQSQLYHRRVGDGDPQQQQRQQQQRRKAVESNPANLPSKRQSVGQQRSVEFEGGGEGYERATETLDPVALMRGKSLGDAEALSRLLMAELPEDEEAENGPQLRSSSSASFGDEYRRTLEVVEAAKLEQLKREEEARAARRLQQLTKQNQDELDEFADEVLSNPPGTSHNKAE